MSKVFSNKKISNKKNEKLKKYVGIATLGTVVTASLIYHIKQLQTQLKELKQQNEQQNEIKKELNKELKEKEELINSMISRLPDKTRDYSSPKNNKELKKQEEEFKKRYDELLHLFNLCKNDNLGWQTHDKQQRENNKQQQDTIKRLTNENNMNLHTRLNELKRISKKFRKSK